MALRISLGQYYDADSVVHRLDPRAKIVGALAIMISVFFINTPLKLALGFAVVLGLVAVARIPARKVLSSVRPIVLTLAFLSLFNLLLTTDGTPLV